MSGRVGILGGSFNPVHNGHLRLAEYIAIHCEEVDSVWLSLSPANPLKEGLQRATDDERLAMLKMAVKPLRPMVDACAVELELPRPSYTIATLRALRERYPDTQFRLIIGADNWAIFHRWRSWQEIINEYGVIVYPRPGYPIDRDALPPGVTVIDGAPEMDVSSTEIRDLATRGESISTLVPEPVANFIKTNSIYTV